MRKEQESIRDENNAHAVTHDDLASQVLRLGADIARLNERNSDSAMEDRGHVLARDELVELVHRLSVEVARVNELSSRPLFRRLAHGGFHQARQSTGSAGELPAWLTFYLTSLMLGQSWSSGQYPLIEHEYDAIVVYVFRAYMRSCAHESPPAVLAVPVSGQLSVLRRLVSTRRALRSCSPQEVIPSPLRCAKHSGMALFGRC